MPKTRRELIDLILDNLGVLVPGQSPSDNDVSRVDNIIDPSVAQLGAMGKIYVPDAGLPNPPSGGEIDDSIFLLLANWMAFQCAGAFNQADSPSLKALALEAEKILRLIGRPASTRRVLTTDAQLSGRHVRTGSYLRGT